jgi:hypothetical protein
MEDLSTAVGFNRENVIMARPSGFGATMAQWKLRFDALKRIAPGVGATKRDSSECSIRTVT